MKAKGLRYLLITLLAVLTAFAVIGCGSGGGGGGGGDSSSAPAGQASTVSGVAATGAAMSGTVSLKDSSNPVVTRGPVAINPDGSFSLDVTGLTPPFYLCADDGVNKLYSVAMDDGLANINPATNIVFANLSGNDPAAYFNDPSAHHIDQASLDQALTDLRTFMSAFLNAYGVSNVDPFTDPFTANGTGLDGLFDDVQVEILNGIVTFRNGLGNVLGQQFQVRGISRQHKFPGRTYR
ncbi:MAG: hypothetical protein HY757_05150 [Nitrospirae bacterium]|nr:hypothetical protein [Nitrospirota bacterium]